MSFASESGLFAIQSGRRAGDRAASRSWAFPRVLPGPLDSTRGSVQKNGHMPQPKPHYLPAGLIGGFGCPNPVHPGRRYAKVTQRRKTPEDKLLREISAENIAFEYGIYDVHQPTADLPANYAEELWEQYEGQLPGAAKALETKAHTHNDWLTVLKHIQSVWPRQPGFKTFAAEALTTDGLAPTNDNIQSARKATIDEMPEQVLAQARFAIIRRGDFARRFIISNRGYVPVNADDTGTSGVLFPLTGNVAVLMARETAQPEDDHQAGPVAVRQLTARGADMFHIATWNHPGIESVVGHPDDADWIGSIAYDSSADLPTHGPYVGNNESLFEWALR